MLVRARRGGSVGVHPLRVDGRFVPVPWLCLCTHLPLTSCHPIPDGDPVSNASIDPLTGSFTDGVADGAGDGDGDGGSDDFVPRVVGCRSGAAGGAVPVSCWCRVGAMLGSCRAVALSASS